MHYYIMGRVLKRTSQKYWRPYVFDHGGNRTDVIRLIMGEIVM